MTAVLEAPDLPAPKFAVDELVLLRPWPRPRVVVRRWWEYEAKEWRYVLELSGRLGTEEAYESKLSPVLGNARQWPGD